ncbi:branched-chain amino acid aminotransferase [Azospirillum sp. TSO22-1]|uniref:branched-chain amino acid aminotransferase n=1 Tax=Azospirillum sp. TSO22-1 TaxID=716789 RepID=UPI000D62016B|nr:branched-chain amino acid aminotransferase [Azospirillum sp. TSO22-1]PWC56024.1 aminotransferase [Azospirillum sp. TSO22-1]
MAGHGTGGGAGALTYVRGAWLEGNPGLIGPMSHAMWLASLVFDGARAFEGVAPDLGLHCARAVRSAQAMGLKPMLTAGEIEELCWDGIRRFPRETALYIRPMFWAEDGFVAPDPDSTQFALTINESPMPPAGGFTACLSTRRRPAPDMAPTEAKAACLYPNAGLALKEAQERGFDNAIMRDPIGNVAEFATANLFIAKDGTVHTPVPNGTFLNGITRQRVIGLLRDAGVTVHERTLTVAEVMAADEVFSTGNYAKVVPVTRVEDRDLQPGPLAKRARVLYWEFAHS